MRAGEEVLITTLHYETSMAVTAVEKELRLIRQRLDSIEEALGEEMTADDKKKLAEALQEHRQGKSVPFAKARKH